MSYVNRFWLPISEYYIENKEVAKLQALNYNKTESYRAVFEYLLSCLQTDTVSNQLRIKNSFKYAINFWGEDVLEDLFFEHLPIINFPVVYPQLSYKEFYIYAWGYMFPNESYLIANKSEYIDIGQLVSY